MEIDLGFLNDAGIDVKTGIEYTGGQEKYVSALSRFFKAYEDSATKIQKAFDMANMEEYMVLVHALKSNSKMLGAAELSGIFENLEEAAGRGDITTVIRDNPGAMEKYAKFAQLIRPIGEADITPPGDEIDGPKAKELSEQLLVALDDFDDELSLDLAKKLWGYPFRLRQREMMNQAIKLITDFNYDAAAEIIREISGSIE